MAYVPIYDLIRQSREQEDAIKSLSDALDAQGVPRYFENRTPRRPRPIEPQGAAREVRAVLLIAVLLGALAFELLGPGVESLSPIEWALAAGVLVYIFVPRSDPSYRGSGTGSGGAR